MSFTYRGTTSDSMFFNVTERQVYNAPAFDVNAIEVPGRSGDVLNSQQRFKNKTLVYTGFIRSSDFPGNTQWERLSRGLRNIKAWICGDAGKYHDLTDDYDPGFIRRAFVSGETAINILFDRPDGATITITFLAEPFMYEVSEPIEVPESDTASGSIATFEGVDAPLKSLSFSIAPSQSGSGDPSPNNIRPISGWSQVDGKQSGMNMLTKVLPNALSLVNNYAKVISGAGTTAVFYAKKGQTYRVSGAIGRNRSLIAYYDTDPVVDSLSNSVYQSPTQDTADGYIFTALQSAYCACYLANSVLSDVNIQVETGSTATPYAAPTLAPITIALGQTVYGGNVDALAGKLVIDRAYDTLTKDSAWYGFSTGTGNSSAVVQLTEYQNCKYVDGSSSYNGAIASTGKELQNYWVNACQNEVPPSGADMGFAYSVGGQVRFHRTDVAGITDLASFKAAFPGTQICYYLKTPIEVDLTPVSVNSLLGQNNIWCNTGETEVGYIVPTENPTQWPSQPRLEITMSGAGTLTVNGKTWSIGSYTGTLICDSEIMDWYDAGALKNSLVSGDGFPELVPGDNVITYTGGITKVVATPRWRTL